MGSKNSKTKSINQPSSSKKKFRKQTAINEYDQREPVKQSETYKFIGLLRVKFKGEKSIRIGTGALIDEQYILTAAHNICTIRQQKFQEFKRQYQDYENQRAQILSLGNTDYQDSIIQKTLTDKDHFQEAEWIEFYPGINGQVEGLESLGQAINDRNQSGTYSVIKNYKIHPKYTNCLDYKKYDVAVLQLQAPLKLEEPFNIIENYSDIQSQISIFGYPRQGCFKIANSLTVRQMGSTGRFQLSQDQRYILYKITTSGGQSGSPIFVNTLNNGVLQRFCIGIHVRGDQNLQRNIAIHIDEQIFRFIIESEENLSLKLNKTIKYKYHKLPEKNIPVPPPKIVTQKSLSQIQDNLTKTSRQLSSTEKIPKLAMYQYFQAGTLRLQQEDSQIAIKHYKMFIKLVDTLQASQRSQNDEQYYDIALINLAKCYCEIGRFQESLSIYLKQEEKCRLFCNLSIQKWSTILNNKGAVFVKLGKYEEALELFKKAYEIRKSQLGSETLLTFNALENYISMRVVLQRDLTECCEYLQKIIKFKEMKFGIQSIQVLNSKMNLGLAYFQQQKYSKSLQVFQVCLKKVHELQMKNFLDAKLQTIRDNIQEKMRELCVKPCELQQLKKGHDLAAIYKLGQLSTELQDEWAKRMRSKQI